MDFTHSFAHLLRPLTVTRDAVQTGTVGSVQPAKRDASFYATDRRPSHVAYLPASAPVAGRGGFTLEQDARLYVPVGPSEDVGDGAALWRVPLVRCDYFYDRVLAWTWKSAGAWANGAWVDGGPQSASPRLALWDPTTRTDERSRAVTTAPGYTSDVWLAEVQVGETVPPVGATAAVDGARLTVTTVGERHPVTLGTPLVARWAR